MKYAARLAAILIFVLTTWSSVSCTGCDTEDIAVYRMVLETFWTEERFPKNYPQYRPRAQWSQVFGQSHNSSYHLYQLGEVASQQTRAFSQTGKVDALVGSGDGEQRVYDQFTAAAIGQGKGKTENVFFVDGGHSMVSLMSRLVPSPDWFVGVDSLELCVDSLWLDEVSLSLEPLDAGAASGLSFTSPHWLTAPPGVVTRHTARFPAHAAAGFYYPQWRHLPTLATVHFTKIKEYSSKDLNDLVHKDVRNKLNSAKEKQKAVTKQAPTTEITTKNNLEILKDLEEDPVGTPRPNLPFNHVIVVTEVPTTSTTDGEFDNGLQSSDDIVLAVANGKLLGRGKHLPRHFRSRLHNAINRITGRQPTLGQVQTPWFLLHGEEETTKKLRPDDDCLVSEWGEWSACSATCGLGERFRTRLVLRPPTPPRGRACPQLREREHCGNANSCFHIDYFEW